MRRRFPVIIPAIIILAALFLGSALLGRNTVRQGRNDINQQTRNFVGMNQPGTIPDSNNAKRNTTGINPTPGIVNNEARQEIRQSTAFDRQRADDLIRRVGNIDGVRRINAIVNGNTAIIGYSPADAGANANSIRRTITDRVNQWDNTITNVVVSGSEDISTRITNFWNNIKASKPVNDLNNEFNQILGNINSAGL